MLACFLWRGPPRRSMESSSTTCLDDLEKLQTLKQHLQNKMSADQPNLHFKPIRTKPERRSLKGIFRDVSVNSSSSEYYADLPVSVPFWWESQPGTPKTRNKERLVPPLTPPPSSTQSPAKIHVKKQPKSTTLLPKVLCFAKRTPRKSPHQHFEPQTLSYTLSPTSYFAPSSECKPSTRAESRQSGADSGDYVSSASLICRFSFGPRLSAMSSGSSSHPSSKPCSKKT